MNIDNDVQHILGPDPRPLEVMIQTIFRKEGGALLEYNENLWARCLHTKPDEFFKKLTRVAVFSPNEDVYVNALHLLRQFLTSGPDAYWDKLHMSTKESITLILLGSISHKKEAESLKLMSLIIGDISLFAVHYPLPQEPWNQLALYIFECFYHDNRELVTFALTVMERAPFYVTSVMLKIGRSERLQQVFKRFEHLLEFPPLDLRIYALQVFVTLLACLPENEKDVFMGIVPKIADTLSLGVAQYEDSVSELIRSLTSGVEASFFTRGGHIHTIMESLAILMGSSNLQFETRRRGLGFYVRLLTSESFEETHKRECVQKLVSTLIEFMSEPGNTRNRLEIGLGELRNIFSSLGSPQIFSWVDMIIDSYITCSKWEMRQVSIQVVGLLILRDLPDKDIQKVITWIQKLLREDWNSPVIWETCNTISGFAPDIKSCHRPTFTIYRNQILEALSAANKREHDSGVKRRLEEAYQSLYPHGC